MANVTEDAVPCVPNPDIAGLGVIITFVTAALLTFIGSVASGVLKIKLASMSKPVAAKAIPEVFLSPLSAYLRLQYLLRSSTSRKARLLGPREFFELWHTTLSQLLLGLGMNQLISGFALYICTVAKYGIYSRDPHARLGYALSSLSMFSQLQIPSVLQQAVETSTLVRLGILFYYVLILFITTAAGFRKTHDIMDLVGAILGLYGVIVATFLLLSQKTMLRRLNPLGNFLSADHGKSLPRMQKVRSLLGKWNDYHRRFFGEPLRQAYKWIDPRPRLKLVIGFLVCAVFTILYLVRVLLPKFGGPERQQCNMNTSKENEWTLGQIFTVLMLAGLLVPATETYIEQLESGENEAEPEPAAGQDPNHIAPQGPDVVAANLNGSGQSSPPLHSGQSTQDIEPTDFEHETRVHGLDDVNLGSHDTPSATSSATAERFAASGRSRTWRMESQQG